jgi:hypothetical protein
MQEIGDILPDSMFGFRPDRSCIDPLFLLRHLHDAKRANASKIFAAAFMDLSGAYDSVNRSLLFDKLVNIGVQLHTIKLLKSLYTNNQCIVKCTQGTAQPFLVHCGLRQGCPLSTTLFNLYIYDLQAHLHRACPDAGVRLTRAGTTPPRMLTDVGYADDITLLASSQHELQQLLDAFVAYCKQHDLHINPSKCQVVVFARKNAWPKASWHVEGKPLERVDAFKYLGVMLHGSSSIGKTVDHRLGCMSRAQSAVYQRMKQLGLHQEVMLMTDLFDIAAKSAGDYGCEIWSTPWLGDWCLHKCDLQKFTAALYVDAEVSARALPHCQCWLNVASTLYRSTG